jgi:hypothetical protein
MVFSPKILSSFILLLIYISLIRNNFILFGRVIQILIKLIFIFQQFEKKLKHLFNKNHVFLYTLIEFHFKNYDLF